MTPQANVVDPSATAHILIERAQGWLREPKIGVYFGGKFGNKSDSIKRDVYESINPANGKILGSFYQAAQADVEDAVRSANAAFANAEWRKMTRAGRAQILCSIADSIDRHREELAVLEALDNGKLYKEALNDDLPEAASVFRYYAGWIDKMYGETCPVEDGFLNYTLREPVGVCALIVPWNFPLLLAAWKLAPALAMGNTVIVKPSPFTSLSMIRLFEILHDEVVLPPGVLNMITGGAEQGRWLTEHPRINKVSFTGSSSTGKSVLRGSADSNLKNVTLELGGKSANIVFADVPDLDFAINRSFDATFSHKGEKCSEPTRLLVHASLYEKFLSGLKKRAEAVRCGTQFDEHASQGAQCNQEQFDKIMRYIDIGKKSGLRLIAGGERDTSGDCQSGYFVRPTIFADVDNQNPVAQDEIFGPVLAVMSFETEEEAIAIANDTIYGLAAGLWTSDVSRAHRVAAQLDAGMVFINKYGCYDFCSPFGGFKQSGWGKEMALHSLDSYTKVKSVWLKI
jgi:aldehyde dehydrogenase (NAD+)